MHIQTVSSRTFNQDPTSVKRAAKAGPVQITERGKVSHVLLSIEKYQELTNTNQNIVDMLSMPTECEFEIDKLDDHFLKPVDFD